MALPDASARFGVTITDLSALNVLGEAGDGGDGTATPLGILRNRYGGVEGLSRALRTDPRMGVSSAAEDVASRRRAFGANYVPPKKAKTLLMFMWEAIQDATLVVLLICGAASIALGMTEGDRKTGWIEGASILVAVAVVVMVTAVNDYQKERQFRRLSEASEDIKVKVVRGGQPTEISTRDLVVGDVLRLDVGDILPADGVLFSSQDLRTDESSLTGESDLVRKSPDEAPFVYSGTRVMEGTGRMLVIAVGENSQSGKIRRMIASAADGDNKASKKKKGRGRKKATGEVDVESGESVDDTARSTDRLIPATDARGGRDGSGGGHDADDSGFDSELEHKSVLQGKLERLTATIGRLGMAVAILTFVALCARFAIETFAIRHEPWKGEYVSRLLGYFITAITVLVVAIPEGLPLAVTLALAFSVRRMLADNNLVRHLDACETMGSATTICSDKTGTLTTNRMAVVRMWAGGNERVPPESLAMDTQAAPLTALLCNGISLNSTAEVTDGERGGAAGRIHTGSKTECALLELVTTMGFPYRRERERASILRMLTFSSARKRMSVAVRLADGGAVLHTKGASEIVLDLCTSVMQPDGSQQALEEHDRSALREAVIAKYAKEGLRTIAIACRLVPRGAVDWNAVDPEHVERNLCLLAIVGIEDPVRAEVPEAIQRCKEAGIVVRMVTGDNIATATAIARKCGILEPGVDPEAVRLIGVVMEGPDFRRRVLDEEGEIVMTEFDKVWPHLRVLARSSPQDKYVLVTGLMRSNLGGRAKEVVAVTGDGTNDAPALAAADVGFSMGVNGTEVAKEASDIVIMDDNFRSIVKAAMWGRNVYDSIAKFVQFQCTVNLVANTTAFVGAVVLEESPLTAIQMLWVNLIMDSLASLSLATEPPTDDLLKRKPYGRSKPIVSRVMLRNIVAQAVYQLAATLTLVFVGDRLLHIPSGRGSTVGGRANVAPTTHYTIVFNSFVLMQLFNQINARKIHGEVNMLAGIARNRLFVVILFLEFVAQAVIVQFGGRVFSTAPLSPFHWGICAAIGVGSLVWQVLVSLVLPPRVLPKRFSAFRKPRCPDEPVPTHARLLWMRGLRRIRAELHVVDAFKQAGRANAERAVARWRKEAATQARAASAPATAIASPRVSTPVRPLRTAASRLSASNEYLARGSPRPNQGDVERPARP